MSDRKYSQRGYQDGEKKERTPHAPKKKEPYDPRIPRDPRTPNMMAFHEVFRCARCGSIEGKDILSLSKCSKCGVELRACIHCVSFDPGARFECQQPLTARVSPKDVANACPSFAPRLRVEKETSSPKPTAARSAFDDLFKS